LLRFRRIKVKRLSDPKPQLLSFHRKRIRRQSFFRSKNPDRDNETSRFKPKNGGAVSYPSLRNRLPFSHAIAPMPGIVTLRENNKDPALLQRMTCFHNRAVHNNHRPKPAEPLKVWVMICFLADDPGNSGKSLSFKKPCPDQWYIEITLMIGNNDDRAALWKIFGTFDPKTEVMFYEKRKEFGRYTEYQVSKESHKIPLWAPLK